MNDRQIKGILDRYERKKCEDGGSEEYKIQNYPHNFVVCIRYMNMEFSTVITYTQSEIDPYKRCMWCQEGMKCVMKRCMRVLIWMLQRREWIVVCRVVEWVKFGTLKMDGTFDKNG